ncbi:E1-E2 ATPase-domain-containing protein [Dichotomopilus funicola]|uniref:E1-E2 ATPase-domain-containing protein n=1 Tax=Dichotomopilus funicola TaxID=1934379 RepID=A0AAN6V9L7_9PEZI|nr:E1-E2 ATPase-domain-containing protein [Dichotomopilus funicola]
MVRTSTRRRPWAAAAAVISNTTTGQNTTTTSFLLANLHCPTCVSTIKDALLHDSGNENLIKWVSPNVVTSVVTVEHTPAASVRRMRDALEESGFEICGITNSAGDVSDLDLDLEAAGGSQQQQGESSNSDSSGHCNNNTNDTDINGTNMDRPTSALSRWFRPLGRQSSHQSQKNRAHLANCEQCRNNNAVGMIETDEKRAAGTMSHHDTLPLSKPTSPLVSSGPVSHAGIRTGTGTSTAMDASKQGSFVAIESDTDVPQLWRVSLAVGGMTCSACANMITEGLKKHSWVANVVVNLVGNSAVVDVKEKEKADEVVEAVEDLGYEATLDSVTELSQGKQQRKGKAGGVVTTTDPATSDLWRATVAIGGMTCAACSNNITRELKKKDWVRDIAVNLLTNSAAIDVQGRANADKLVDEIEDLGYDAALDAVVSLAQETDNGEEEEPERTVEIRIEGLYCEHCPERVTSSLAGFRSDNSNGRRRQLEVLTPPTRQRPILKLTYTPNAPGFTIRTILAAIEASDPGFTASVYHPPTLEERSKQIQRQHRRQILFRTIFTGIVCIPSFVIGIVYMSLVPHTPDGAKHFLMKSWVSGISRAQIALFIMATPVYFFAADLFHRRAIKEIRTLWRRGSRVPLLQRFYRFGSMNTLMSLGTTIAFISSVSQMIAAAVYQPAEVNDSNFYFDSVVFLTFFLLLGRLIESYSKSKTGDAVEMLGKLRPTTAVLVEGYGTEKEADVVVKADLLDFGDVVRVTHGASPPADGVVVRGQSNFDESSLTGESRLVAKAVGDGVFAGTVNKDASLLVRITGVAGSSMLDQIVHVVREGQTKRAPIEQVADLLTSYFVPVVTFIAVFTWIIWLSLGLGGHIPDHYLDVTSGGWVAFSLQFAISVFVVACPCGLALAAPTAIFVGSGLAAKHGILAKGGGEAFEKASRIDCVVFDKTGTLTVGGEPKITDSEVYPEEEGEKEAVLATLKAVEENSSHPIAKAIVAFCAEHTSARVDIDGLQEVPGKGMKATYRGTSGQEEGSTRAFELAVGNEAFMADFAVTIPNTTTATLQRWKSEAKSVALVATRAITPTTEPESDNTNNWTLAAALSISDPIRPEAPRIIAALQGRGTRVWMLSGDNPTTAAAVAAQLGIPPDQVIAGVLPTGKADKIKYLQSTLRAGSSSDSNPSEKTQRAMVAMIGDGINDSPALATADVGVAIGSGADVAISSADFVLVKSDLRAVVDLLDLSRVVFRRIKFNFGWAVVYNCVALPVAAGAFYPIMSKGQHVRLDPVWASLAMALSSISVVLSSLMLRVGVRGVGFRERRIE